MAKKPHTSLSCSKDGPWVTIRGDDGNALTMNYREHIREIMPAERISSRRRIMSQWLKARDDESKPEPALDPPPENERRKRR